MKYQGPGSVCMALLAALRGLRKVEKVEIITATGGGEG